MVPCLRRGSTHHRQAGLGGTPLGFGCDPPDLRAATVSSGPRVANVDNDTFAHLSGMTFVT